MRLVVVCLALLISVASAGTWTAKFTEYSVLTGISCVSDQTCFVGGGDNGIGAFVARSDDAAQTWNILPMSNTTMLVLDVDAISAQSAVLTGVGLLTTGNQFTLDGHTFETALDLTPLSTSQDAEHVAGSLTSYATVGDFGSVSGVAFSGDAGFTYAHADWKGNTDARYGSFPSATTWYISGGTWPDTKKEEHIYSVSSHIHFNKLEQTYKLGRMGARPKANDTGFVGTITKTTDGGKTWQTLFNDTGRFYFNQISCPDELHCWAAAEGDGTPNGAWIWATADGGKTWTQQIFFPNESVIALTMLSLTEGWAGGATTDTFVGSYYHTTDGGKTWTAAQTINGAYVFDYSFPDAQHGFATLLTNIGVCGTATYA